MDFRFEIDASEIHKVYKRINHRIKSKNVLLNTKFKPLFKSEVAKNFVTQGRPGGGRSKFSELALSTRKQRRLQGFPEKAPILIRRGRLLGKAAGSDIRFTFYGDKIRAYPNVSGKYARVMRSLHYGRPETTVSSFGVPARKGKPAGKGTMAARPYFFVTKTAFKKFSIDAADYFYGR